MRVFNHGIPGVALLPLDRATRDGKAPVRGLTHADARPDYPIAADQNVALMMDAPGAPRLITIDVDNPELADVAAWPETWTQETPSGGRHHVYRLPEGYELPPGPKNPRLRRADGTAYGDVRFSGYIVGPGSVRVDADGNEVGRYRRVNDLEPVEAPPEVLRVAETMIRYQVVLAPASIVATGLAVEGVDPGGHDSALASVAGYLRSHFALSEDAIREDLAYFASRRLLGVDPARPFTDADFRRHARQAMTYAGELAGIEASFEADAVLEPEVEEFWDMDDKSADRVWLFDNLFAMGEFSLVTGDGGVGKTSVMLYLICRAALRGRNCAIIQDEDDKGRMATRIRSILGNERPPGRIVRFGNKWEFPQDAGRLRALMRREKIEVLYMDAIAGLLGHDDSKNAAEKTRYGMAPVAAIAAADGVAIIGTKHKNKQGADSGSTEWRNLCRTMVKADRAGADALVLTIDKSNNGHAGLIFDVETEERPLIRRDGTPVLKRFEEAPPEPETQHIVVGVRKRAERVGQVSKNAERDAEIVAAVRDGASQNSVAARFGLGKQTISDVMAKARRQGGGSDLPPGLSYTPRT